MKKLFIIFLIVAIACANTEEENKNPFDKAKEDIEKKAKEIAEQVANKAKEIADDVSQKAQEMGEDISEKAKEIAEDVSGKAKEIVKDFMKFFEKLNEEAQMAIIWLKENGYWDEIVQIAENIGKTAAVQACKTYVPTLEAKCDVIVQFIFDAIISLVDQIKNKEESN